MIVKPWESKGNYKAYAYPIITTKKSMIEFMKRKRKTFTVIIKGRMLPCNCAYCGKPISKDEPNLVDCYPKKKAYYPMHYTCAWQHTFRDIDKLYSLIN